MAGTEATAEGYAGVAVCRRGRPSWRLRRWDALSDKVLEQTYLVRADQYIEEVDRPPALTGAQTVEDFGDYVLRRRPRTRARIADYRPLSGVPVMAIPDVRPNAVLCTQGRRPTPTDPDAPFRVAPRYQGVDGVGPQPAALPEDWLPPSARRGRVEVGIIDTGLGQGRFAEPLLEPFLDARSLVAADVDDVPDADGDGWPDMVAGHGTAVAGLIAHGEPRVRLHMVRAVDAQGALTDADLARAIDKLVDIVAPGRLHLLNLSLGGWTHDNVEPVLSGARLRRLYEHHGTAIVAAAGNLGSARKFWPAAMPQVIGVAAGRREGATLRAADYSNRGEWVDVVAPEGRETSTFFRTLPAWRGTGVRWDGTSFKAPLVTSRLASIILDHDVDARAAWELLRKQASGGPWSGGRSPEFPNAVGLPPQPRSEP
jgi:hypothetical protein